MEVRFKSAVVAVFILGCMASDGRCSGFIHWEESSELEDFCIECFLKKDMRMAITEVIKYDLKQLEDSNELEAKLIKESLLNSTKALAYYLINEELFEKYYSQFGDDLGETQVLRLIFKSLMSKDMPSKYLGAYYVKDSKLRSEQRLKLIQICTEHRMLMSKFELVKGGLAQGDAELQHPVPPE